MTTATKRSFTKNMKPINPQSKLANLGLAATVSGPDMRSSNLRPEGVAVYVIKYVPPPPPVFMPPPPKEPWRGGRPR